MNKTTFEKYFFGMAEYFGKDLSEFVVSAYWGALKDMPDDLFIENVNRSIKESRFFPKVADLIGRDEEDKARRIKTKAMTQAENVIAAIRRIGSYRHPTFKDPITKRLFSGRFSWFALCSMTEDDIKWWRKDFIAEYEELAKNRQKDKEIEASGKVLGLIGDIGEMRDSRARC